MKSLHKVNFILLFSWKRFRYHMIKLFFCVKNIFNFFPLNPNFSPLEVFCLGVTISTKLSNRSHLIILSRFSCSAQLSSCFQKWVRVHRITWQAESHQKMHLSLSFLRLSYFGCIVAVFFFSYTEYSTPFNLA